MLLGLHLLSHFLYLDLQSNLPYAQCEFPPSLQLSPAKPVLQKKSLEILTTGHQKTVVNKLLDRCASCQGCIVNSAEIILFHGSSCLKMLRGLFWAVSTPNVVSKYSFEKREKMDFPRFRQNSMRWSIKNYIIGVDDI